ncbi:MAG: inositol monophosphatase family protein [Acidimicrobiia bacterium]
MTALDLAQLLEVAERAARIGGEVVTAGFGDASNVRAKAPGDWVSDVDTASERAVREALAAVEPDIAFFGEEGGGDRASLGWLVDPLDGTANFLHGLPAVGVSIGLVEDGQPIVAVVHAPLLGDTYCAMRGGGATCNGVPISVSTRAPSDAIPATGFPFRHKERLDAFLEVFHTTFEAVEDLRRVGAASLDLAWTAAGVFDGFFELALGPWDVAAGALLVREAGGVVTDWVGDPDAWLVSGDILAAPPAVHARLLDITRVADV